MVAAAEIATPVAGRPRRARWLRSLGRNRTALVGGAVVLIVVAAALLAPWISPYGPLQTDWSLVRKAPSAAHWLGTDELGRDILSRMLYGTRASLMAGVISVAIALAIGVPLGLLSGYLGGWTDSILMRVVDAALAIPFLVLAIALAAFLGPSLNNAMIAIGLASTPLFVRLTRAQTMAVKVEDYVEAARAVGAPHVLIVIRHVLPNVLPPILVQATVTVAVAIIAEASLSFLGLGQQPPAPSWGSMLNVAKGYLHDAPWMALWPGIAIYLTVLGFNFLGDGLHDALDPRDV